MPTRIPPRDHAESLLRIGTFAPDIVALAVLALSPDEREQVATAAEQLPESHDLVTLLRSRPS